MKIAGIIAEYNPFHNGHAYQIKELKKRTDADYIIAVISGDFVQRGAPAVMDKYARTRMALSYGIDLVIELPSLWSAASAEHFASAGVALLDKMGCVDILCFGAETDQPPLFAAVSKILADEPDLYRETMVSNLKMGLVFPLARERALTDYLLKKSLPCSDMTITRETIHDFLSSPNNILALEYQKALYLRSSSITPVIIKREGAGYHEKKITAKNASARAIRKLLLEQQASFQCILNTPATAKNPDKLHMFLPDTSCRIIEDYRQNAAFLTADDFSPILGFLLLNHTKESLSVIADCTPDLAGRLTNHLFSFCSVSQFCELNKSRNTTYTRISRILTHILLHHTKEDYSCFLDMDYIPYLRMLGFRKKSEPLLGILKKSAEIPLISKLADAAKILDEDALSLLKKDVFAANLYEQVKCQKSCLKSKMIQEYSKPLIIV